jgi:hypothetical protein
MIHIVYMNLAFWSSTKAKHVDNKLLPLIRCSSLTLDECYSVFILFVCFFVLSRTSNFSAILRLSP